MHKPAEIQLHFVGIGGIGMSGIAEVFLNQGYRVTGSDLSETDITRRLQGLGARIFSGHQAGNVEGAQVVVISSAVKPSNPEVQAARRLRIPVIPRAEMLGELMRGKIGIAVAGTHGKTTTTSMLATILTQAGADPTVVVGGRVDSLGGNAKLGQGDFVVAEADESDGSFLHLPATFAVVTNIDSDHLDHYRTLGAVDEAFAEFIAKLPFYGLAAVCGDDEGVRRSLQAWSKPVMTYGLSEGCDLFAKGVELSGLSSAYTLCRRSAPSGSAPEILGPVRLNVPGKHNVLNSLGALSIAIRIGIPFERATAALASFCGVRRRFDVLWRDPARNRAIVDDYGHHPTEVEATLAAARAFWPGRIITVFQPHRYTRTRDCWEAFVSAFGDTDVLLMTDVYAAGEEPIEGIHPERLCGEIRDQHADVSYVGDLSGAKEALSRILRDGDLVLCLGAGSITRFAAELAAQAKGTS